MKQRVEEICRAKAKAYVAAVLSVRRMAGEFGFTPVSRQRINQGPAEESDPLADLFSGIR